MDISKIGFLGATQTQTKKTAESKSATRSVVNHTEVISKNGNDALRSTALAGINLCRSMIISQNGSEYKIDGKYKVIGEMPTKQANEEWAARGYTEMPYKDGQTAQIIELTKETKFVRVFDNENSYKAGSWLMKYDDVKGKTPEQIANDFALPQVPKYICDATLPAGTKLRTGECNPLFGYSGGGRQFDLMGERVGKFDNEREIGNSAK